jgi:hypothetical protein
MTRWQAIKGYDGRYEISDDGKVRSMISRGEAAEIVRRAARAALENKND